MLVQRRARDVLNDDYTETFGCCEDGGSGVNTLRPNQLKRVSQVRERYKDKDRLLRLGFGCHSLRG